MNEIAIQHPILYESYNICQMALTSKLSNFSIAMLQDICKQEKTLHRPFAGIGEIMYLSDLAISLSYLPVQIIASLFKLHMWSDHCVTQRH